MPYKMSDLIWGVGQTSAANSTGGIYWKLSQRDDVGVNPALALGWIQETLLELGRTYAFIGLQKTGPLFQLTAQTYQYALTNFLQAGDTTANLVPSFFLFFGNPTPPVTSFNNNGLDLTFQTIDALEQMFLTPGTPAYWSRFSDQIYVAPLPDQAYFARMRYQIPHPFTGGSPAGSFPALSDPLLLPDEWKDVVEYAAAQRGATNFRMLDYATQYHNILFGDPQFQRSSGATGMPGLIARREMQLESDTTSQTRSIRVRRGR